MAQQGGDRMQSPIPASPATKARLQELERKLAEAAAREKQYEEDQQRRNEEHARLRLENERLAKIEGLDALEQLHAIETAEAARIKARKIEASLRQLQSENEARERALAAERQRAAEQEKARAAKIAALERALERITSQDASTAENTDNEDEDEGGAFEFHDPFDGVWSIQIPSYRIRESVQHIPGLRIVRPPGWDTYAQFEVRITLRGEEWRVYREYEQFEALHTELIRRMGKEKLRGIHLPPHGRFFEERTEVFLDDRREKLQEYLTDLISLTCGDETSPFYSTTKARLQRELAFFDVFPIARPESSTVGAASYTPLVGGLAGSLLQVVGMAAIVAVVAVGVRSRLRRV